MPIFGKQFTVARVSGISIAVDPSWIIIFLFLTWGLSAGYFPATVAGRNPALYWVYGVLASLSLFLSVTLHELGHSLVARARGMEVNRIVLFIFGGASQLEEEPEKPGSEFMMAIVGPLVSFLLAAACWTLHNAIGAPKGTSLTAAFFGYLAFINLVLGIFNLLPGFPLDGGRVLRSILWSHWKDQVRATRVASQVGSGFGLALMLVGGLQILGGNAVGGFWYILIGFFLRNAAQSSYQQMALKRVLDHQKVRDLMTENPISVSPDVSLRDLAEGYILQNHHTAYPVMEGPDLLGLVQRDNLKKVPREEWDRKTVRTVMTPMDKLSPVSPDDPAGGLIRLLSVAEGPVLVVKEGRLAGILSRRDLFDYITLRGESTLV